MVSVQSFGNWIYEATGVPEPSGLSLLLLGLSGWPSFGEGSRIRGRVNKEVRNLLLKKLDLVLLFCGALIFAVSSEGRAHPGHEGDTETAAGSSSGLPAPQVSITEEG